MKPTSSLSFLLILHLNLTISVPIPITHSNGFPLNCITTTCHLSLPHLLSAYLHPDFRTHQLFCPSCEEGLKLFDKPPITPPTRIPPSVALALNRPTESSYLRSLSNTAATHTLQHLRIEEEGNAVGEVNDATPTSALPTSVLPELRKEDAESCWVSVSWEKESVGAMSSGQYRHCGGFRDNMCIKPQDMLQSEDYADIMVIGIVVLFLAIVCVMESLGKIRSLMKFLCARTNRPRRGEIFFKDDETSAVQEHKN